MATARTDLTREQREALLAEYDQASVTSRADSRIVQWAFQVYWVFITALGGFLAKEHYNIRPEVFVLLTLSAVLLGIATLLLLSRQYRYMKVYMERARCIEQQLDLHLFRNGYDAVSTRGISNKKVLQWLIGLSAALYFAIALWIGLPWLCIVIAQQCPGR
jgi:hypothetical protein